MAQQSNVVSGVVRGPQNNPVAQARVYFTRGPGPIPEIAALTDDRGHFSLTAPSAGTYTLECVAEGFTPAVATVSVRSGQETFLEITLSR